MARGTLKARSAKPRTSPKTKPAVAAKTKRAAKPITSRKARPKQKFTVSHYREADFAEGLRNYAKYRDLGVAEASHGLQQCKRFQRAKQLVHAG